MRRGLVDAPLPDPSLESGSTMLAAGMASGIGDLVYAAVESVTGWPGLGVIFSYSFLIAIVLPGPSEVVLVAPLDLGLPLGVQMSLVTVVSAMGKTAGSLVAFHLGQEAKRAGPVVRWLGRSRFDVIEWSETQTVTLAKRYGYAGLALALCVPFFPDTLSIYAFALLEEDSVTFAIAVFLGSLGRLLLILAAVSGIVAAF